MNCVGLRKNPTPESRNTPLQGDDRDSHAAETATASHPVAQTLHPSAAQNCAPRVRVVSDAVELCRVGRGGTGATWYSSLGRDGAALAA